MSAGVSVQTSKNQQGMALLVLVIVIMLGFATYTLSGLSINQIKVDNTIETSIALKKAKDALLSYAAIRSELEPPMVLSAQPAMYGYLPCPANYNGDGNSVGTCGSEGMNTLGWFPWRSLRMSPLKDGNGDCLLYAVSSTYKFNMPADMLNQDSYGMFSLRNETGVITQGATAQDRIVAMIFSSGKALSGQNRINNPTSECNNDAYNFSAYLDAFEVAPGDVIDNSAVDTVNINQVDEFIHETTNSESAATPYNDRFVIISRDEIRDALFNHAGFVGKMENLTQALAMCLASYANHTDNTSRRLPWPAKTDLGGADYGLDASYQDNAFASTSGGYSGRFPFDVADSNAAINNAAMTTDEVFNMAGCSALALTGSGAGVTVDLVTSTSEYRKLWNHWKDHFFYILSKRYEPDPDSSDEQKCGGNKCIRVNTKKYAGAVIFSGRRLDGVVRSDKSVVADYLNDGNAADFADEAADKDGNERYDYTDPQTDTENDIMYCIQDKKEDQTPRVELDVVECP